VLNKHRIPTKGAEVLDIMAENGGSLGDAARQLGIGYNVSYARIQTVMRNCTRDILLRRYPNLVEFFDRSIQFRRTEPGVAAVAAAKIAESPPPPIVPIVPIDPSKLLQELINKMCTAVACIDDTKLSTAKLGEIMSTIKTMFDITQVLQGKPTSISRSDNLKALKDLAPALLRELNRRGVTIDAKVAERVDVVTKAIVVEDVKDVKDDKVRIDVPGAGSEAHPPVGVCSGPINHRDPSEFSKILENL